MAILSAGINFGKPATEFIVESDESGVIQSCRNVVTGVEYAGGGGGGDFTTAEVDIVMTAGARIYAPCYVDDGEMSFIDTLIADSGSYDIIINNDNITAGYVTYSGDTINVSVTGDIMYDNEEKMLMISGAGTITLSE